VVVVVYVVMLCLYCHNRGLLGWHRRWYRFIFNGVTGGVTEQNQLDLEMK
jgi:hypothetical protein